MTYLEKLEKRWMELVEKPDKNQKVEDILQLAKTIELEQAKEYNGLITELKGIGIKITSVWDLVNTRANYPEAIPLLLKYLPLVGHPKNKEGIIRALTVREAKGLAVPILLAEYAKMPKSKQELRWVVGNAVNITITKSDVDDILPIVRDKSNGKSRHVFASALGKVKSEAAENVLIELLDDEDVAAFAVESLGRLKSKKAREKIAALADHPHPLIKKEVVKALKKIG